MTKQGSVKRYAGWYITIAVSIKLVVLFFFALNHSPTAFNEHRLYEITGDAYQYVEPVENLIQHGEHRINSGALALRMPGYTPVLLAFRSFLSQRHALNMTLITQAILSGISCLVLALIALRIFGSIRLFHFVFWLYAISTYVSIFDGAIMTESLAASTLVFATYFLIKGTQEERSSYFVLSGVFLCWSIFLRPFLLPILGLYALCILLVERDQVFTLRAKGMILFLLPFLITDAAWTIRNQFALGEFIPLQSRVTYNDGSRFDPERSLIASVCDLTSSFGSDHTWWNPKEPAYWFVTKGAEFPEGLFPDQLFSEQNTQADLKAVRESCIELDPVNGRDTLFPEQKRIVIARLQEFHDQYQRDHPFHYHLTSRLIHLKRFVLHSGVYNIPFPKVEEQTIWQRSIKAGYALLYLFVMLIGGITCILLFVGKFDLGTERTYVLAVPLFLLLFFPLILKMHEFRFNVLCYPFFLIAACYAMDQALMRIKPQKDPNTDNGSM